MRNKWRKIAFLFLWLTIFTIPFQKSFIIVGIGSINKVMAVLLVIMTIFAFITRGTIKKIPSFLLFSFIFILFNLSSFFWATVPSDALEKSLLFFQVWYISWAIYEYSDSFNHLINIMKAFVLGCVVIALQSVYQFITVGPNSLSNTSRFFLEGYNPNELGVLWVIGFIMSIYLVLKGYTYFIVYVPLAIFTILLTGSRSAIVILIFVLLSTVWMLFKNKIRFRKTIFTIATITGLILLYKVPKAQLNRLSTIKYELASGTLNGRTGIWDSGIQTFRENPFLGVGGGSFLEASLLNSLTGIEFSAHNAYLSVLVENGIVGFVLFAVMISILLYKAHKISNNNYLKWLNLTLIYTWLIISFVSHTEAQKFTWVLFGIIITASYLSEKNLSDNKFSRKNIVTRNF